MFDKSVLTFDSLRGPRLQNFSQEEKQLKAVRKWRGDRGS